MGTSAPDTARKGLDGARRWSVVVLGLALASLGAYLLLPQRVHELTWYVTAEEPSGVDVALVVDTRGAPLRMEGADPGGSSRVTGEAGTGFELRAASRAVKRRAVTMRLVAPSGEVVWEHASEPGEPRARLPLTVLDEVGEWRLEVTAEGRGSVASVDGYLRGSRWDDVSGGQALPITWIVAGMLAVGAVWFGLPGSRAAGSALLLAGASMPLLGAGIHGVFSAYPPGDGAMVVATALLVLGGALALGWTWPREEGPPPRRTDVVVGFVGASLVAIGARAFLDLPPCVERSCLPHELLDDTLVGLSVMGGLGLVGVASWRVGRRSADNDRCVRVVGLSLLGCVLFAIAGLVLGLGAFVVGITAWGIGLGDQGPDPPLAAIYLGCGILISGLLGWASYLSFRGAVPDGRKGRRLGPPPTPDQLPTGPRGG